MAKSRPTVYLAGPMSGCTSLEKTVWRDEIKKRFSDHFEFIDPVDSGIDEAASSYQRVTQDRKDIERCDAVLANLWKMSSGTAIGIVLARNKGKFIVLLDENSLSNSILSYYCDRVVRDVGTAIKELLWLFQNDLGDLQVMKQNGSVSPFRIPKVVMSIRKACQSAGVDDVTFPPLIIPDVMEEIEEVPRRAGKISTEAIAHAVLRALDRGAIDRGDSDFSGSVARIRDAWRRWVLAHRPSRFPDAIVAPVSVSDARIRRDPLKIRLASEKSHHTIWGTAIRSIDDLPSDARSFFREVARVKGIQRISLTAFRAQGLRDAPASPRVKLALSKNPTLIEGVLRVRGKLGHIQNFTIELSDPSDREDILDSLRSVLAPTYMRSN